MDQLFLQPWEEFDIEMVLEFSKREPAIFESQEIGQNHKPFEAPHCSHAGCFRSSRDASFYWQVLCILLDALNFLGNHTLAASIVSHGQQGQQGQRDQSDQRHDRHRMGHSGLRQGREHDRHSKSHNLQHRHLGRMDERSLTEQHWMAERPAERLIARLRDNALVTTERDGYVANTLRRVERGSFGGYINASR